MINLITPLFAVFFAILLSILFVILCDKFKMASVSFSSSYFLALPVFLSLWRLLGWAMGMRLALLFVLLTILLLLWIYRAELFKFCKQNQILLLKYLLLYLFIQIVVILFWSQSLVENAYSTVGSGHSPRYGNIALFIQLNDQVPLVGQNYSQSVLASLTSILFNQSPLWALNCWLAVSLSFLIFLANEFLDLFSLGKTHKIFALLILFLGNTAISLTHFLTLDSMSPFIISAYPDIILSIGSFLALVFFSKVLEVSYPGRFLFFIQFLVYYFWTMACVQNYYLLAFCMLTVFIQKLKKCKETFFYFTKISIIILVCLILARYSGGMFVDKSRIRDLPFSGMQTNAASAQSLMTFDVCLPMVKGNFSGWGTVCNSENDQLEKLRLTLMGMGWPLIAMLVVIFIFMKGQKNLLVTLSSVQRQVLILGGVCFFSAIFFAVPLNPGGYKWELSRFIAVGYFCAMLSLSIGICLLMKKKYMTTCLLIVILGLTGYGPVTSIYQRFHLNFYQGAGFPEKFRAILDFDHYTNN